MIRYAITLMLICLLSSGILAATYRVTHPVYLEQLEKEEMQGLEELLPKAVGFEAEKYKDISYFMGKNIQDKTMGYIIKADISGYSSTIKVLVGIDREGNILGIRILSQEETPGLGARITEIKHGEREPWFTRQFKGKNFRDLRPDNIEAITAATITSKAIIEGIKKEIEEILPALK